jgi:hypothetical protein
MATERVTERRDRTRGQPAAERDAADQPRGARIREVIGGMAILALVAVIAFYLLNQSRHDYLRVSAVTGAAATVAGSPSTLARNVGDAAGVATDQTTR